MASVDKDLREIILNVVIDELSDTPEVTYEDPVMEYLAVNRKKRPELLGTGRIQNYVDQTVPTYSDPLFRAHFRMTWESVQSLLELIGPHTTVRTLSLVKRTLACLWYLANQESFRGVADRFGMSKGSLHYYLGSFCRVMSSEEVMSTLVCWPDRRDYGNIAEGFAKRAGFLGAIGAVNGTYIKIPGPSEFRDSYICRKGWPAFHLQGVCDSKLRFLDVYCAYPGSVHDSRVFRNCPLSDKLQTEGTGQYHLLGDSAYSLSPYLLVPFRDNVHLSREQKRYNNAHSSTRVDIEHCFGLLKGKFRKLKYLDMLKVEDVPITITACCALHNFILRQESYTDEDIDSDDLDGHEQCPVQSPSVSVTEAAGSTKREEITNMLA